MFFTITNCQIVRSRSLTYHKNSFHIEYFGLSQNRRHNLPESEQQYQLNEALNWVPVLLLSGDCIFAFGDHFFFDDRQKATWNFFNFEPCIAIYTTKKLSVYFLPNFTTYKTTQILPLKNMASPLCVETFQKHTVTHALTPSQAAFWLPSFRLVAVSTLVIPRNPDARSVWVHSTRNLINWRQPFMRLSWHWSWISS